MPMLMPMLMPSHWHLLILIIVLLHPLCPCATTTTTTTTTTKTGPPTQCTLSLQTPNPNNPNNPNHDNNSTHPIIVPFIQQPPSINLTVILCPASTNPQLTVRTTLPISFSISTLTSHQSSCTPISIMLKLPAEPSRLSVSIAVKMPSCVLPLPIIIPGFSLALPSTKTPTGKPHPIPTLQLPHTTMSNPIATVYVPISLILPSTTTITAPTSSQLARHVIITMHPRTSGLSALVLPSSQNRTSLRIQWQGHDLEASIQPTHITLQLRAPSLFAHKASLRVSLPPPVPSVIRFLLPRPVLSAAGGDYLVAIMTPQKPPTATCHLVLMLPDGNVTVAEAFHKVPGSGKPVSKVTFRMPPVSIPTSVQERIPWALQITHKGRTRLVEDRTAGFAFAYAKPPTIFRVVPSRFQERMHGKVVFISGLSLQKVKVFLNDRKQLQRHVISASNTHIAFKPLLKAKLDDGDLVNVTVVSQSGISSNTIAVPVDHSMLEVDAQVLSSSQGLRNSPVVIPLICGLVQAPVVAAFLPFEEQLNENPVYNFSIRTDEASSDFRPIASGNDSMAMLSESELFSNASDLAGRLLFVLVTVQLDTRVGTTLLTIERQAQPHTLGLTVSSQDSALRVDYSSLRHCADFHDFRVDVEWTVDGKVVPLLPAAPDNETEFPSLSSPAVIDLGTKLTYPVISHFSYGVKVSVVNVETGVLVCKGKTNGMVAQKNGVVNVVLNGGARFIVLPTGLNSFRIHSFVQTTGDVKDMTFIWNCSSISSVNDLCPASLSSDRLSQTNVTEFDISTRNIAPGSKFNITVQVALGGLVAGETSVHVQVGEKDVQVFPETTVQSFGCSRVYGTQLTDFSIGCYERIIFSTLQPGDEKTEKTGTKALNFQLFRDVDDDPTKDYIQNNGDILLSHPGYWSPSDRTKKMFGIDMKLLQAGSYTLHGMVEGKGNEVTRLWNFLVRSCAEVEMSDLVVRQGVVKETVFTVFAKTVGGGEVAGTFVIAMQEVKENVQKRLHKVIDSALEATTGTQDRLHIHTNNVYSQNGRAVASSFTMPRSGEFFIHVDMYDITGSILLSSATSSKTITVTDASDDESNENSVSDIQQLTSALQRRDEIEFVALLSCRGINTKLPSNLLDDVINVLASISKTGVKTVFKASSIIDACATVMHLGNPMNETTINRLLVVVDRLISSSVKTAASDILLRPPLERFYARVTESLSEAASLRQTHMRAFQDDFLKDMAYRTREKSAWTIALALSTGQECGASNQFIIPHKKGGKIRHDDYRIGVECYDGQIQALPPKPDMYETCTSTSQQTNKHFTAPALVMSSAQHDVATIDDDEMSYSAIVNTRFAHRRTAGSGTIVQSDHRPNSCHRTRLIAQLDDKEDDANTRSEEYTMECTRAGTVTTWEGDDGMAGKHAGKTADMSTFTVHVDGEVSVSMEQLSNGSMQLRVNKTALRHCRSIMLAGEANTNGRLAIIISVSIFMAIACVAVCLLVCARRRRKNGDRLVKGADDGATAWRASHERRRDTEYSIPSASDSRYALESVTMPTEEDLFEEESVTVLASVFDANNLEEQGDDDDMTEFSNTPSMNSIFKYIESVHGMDSDDEDEDADEAEPVDSDYMRNEFGRSSDDVRRAR